MRTQMRRVAFGLVTVLGLRKLGFFIPYRYADQLPGSGERSPYRALERLFVAAEPAFVGVLELINARAEALAAIGQAPPPEPRWNQDWFPRLDAAATYALVRETQPRRIVEVGSGHSTRFMARAIRDAALATELSAIDPAPRADIDGIGATISRYNVQAVGIAPFEALQAGDVLFIDSSHILLPGTDVDFLFNHVLPMLPAGVLIHVHDVFLPDDYPSDWDWRGYNEQLGIAALIQGGTYQLIWSSHYAATRMADQVAASAAGRLELKPGARESSLWLVKT
jgi:predicted O-methyltransferase YrrM